MFGKKTKQIEELQKYINIITEDVTWYKNSCQLTGDARDQLSKELDQTLESNVVYETSIKSLEEELARFHDINSALADESRDLSNRLYLLQDVLRQLQIPVKLPARKR